MSAIWQYFAFAANTGGKADDLQKPLQNGKNKKGNTRNLAKYLKDQHPVFKDLRELLDICFNSKVANCYLFGKVFKNYNIMYTSYTIILFAMFSKAPRL